MKVGYWIGLKKKMVVLPSSGVSEYLGGLVGKYFFSLIIFLKSTQKYQIWVHFLPFFYKKVKKKTSNLTKIGCIPDPNFFILFFEIGRSLRTTHFCSWPGGPETIA